MCVLFILFLKANNICMVLLFFCMLYIYLHDFKARLLYDKVSFLFMSDFIFPFQISSANFIYSCLIWYLCAYIKILYHVLFIAIISKSVIQLVLVNLYWGYESWIKRLDIYFLYNWYNSISKYPCFAAFCEICFCSLSLWK